jgi:hypothetical protein
MEEVLWYGSCTSCIAQTQNGWDIPKTLERGALTTRYKAARNVMLDKQSFVHEEIAEDFLCREQTRNLFGQPDVIVIHEFLHVYRSSTAHTPEIKLIAAVLEDAIDCYLKYCSAKSRRGKRIFAEAGQWIFDRDDDWLFGFDNICEMLKLDPDYIRRVLKQSEQERLLNQLSEHQQPTDFPAIALRLAS